MYKIELKTGEVETFKTVVEINNFVSKIGNDGGVMVWLTDTNSHGVINYYNTIYATVIWEEEVPEKEAPKTEDVVLRAALQQYDKDDLVCLLEKYSHYVASVHNDVPRLLKYLMERQ